MKWLEGKKTYIGCAIVAGSAVLEFLGFPEIAGMLIVVGGSLGIAGLGGKAQKAIDK